MPQQINGLQLPGTLVEGALGGSPGDAAQVFLDAASRGMAKVVKDALVGAIGEALGAAPGGPPPQWVELVKGCSLVLNWETVPGSQPRTVVAIAPEAAALGGIDVGVTVTAHF